MRFDLYTLCQPEFSKEVLPPDLDFAPPPPPLDPLPPGDVVPPLGLTGVAGAGVFAGVDGFGAELLVGADRVCVTEGVVRTAGSTVCGALGAAGLLAGAFRALRACAGIGVGVRTRASIAIGGALPR
jgi:hypothetical protein